MSNLSSVYEEAGVPEAPANVYPPRPDQEYRRLERRLQLLVTILERRVEDTRDEIGDTLNYVDALESRLLIVDELPADAPLGALIRLRVGTVGQRATLYLGNGQGQPLSKLVPVPL